MDENPYTTVWKRVTVLTVAALVFILLMIGLGTVVSILWFRLLAG
jgi:hypothetical protein